ILNILCGNVALASQEHAFEQNEHIKQRTEYGSGSDAVACAAECAIGGEGLRVHVVLSGERDQAFPRDHSDENANRKGAAAESECIDVRARAVVAAKKLVQVDDIALETPSKGAAENRERLE